MYVKLEDLLVYKLALELSDLGWQIYEPMPWQLKKVIGDQFITALDSVGANIAEGTGRYHFLDQIKFYYNARGSLVETKHWVELFRRRNLVTPEIYNNLIRKLNNAHYQINVFINNCYKNRQSTGS